MSGLSHRVGGPPILLTQSIQDLYSYCSYTHHHHHHHQFHPENHHPHNTTSTEYLFPTTTHEFESNLHHPPEKESKTPQLLSLVRNCDYRTRSNSVGHRQNDDSDSSHHSNLSPSSADSLDGFSSGTRFIELQRPSTPPKTRNVLHINTDIVKMEPEVNDINVDENSSTGEGRSLSERNGKHHKNGLIPADPKLCGVCGDKALGNNFNAITCESCKAFFRRNALRTKEFVCPFSDNCKVDPVTRRFCQKCRLKKCFDIGMKKEWIMTDEEKKMKKQKIEQNRLKRASSSDVRETDPTNPKERALDHDLINPGEASNSSSSEEGQPFEHTQTQQQQPQPMMPHNNNSLPVQLQLFNNTTNPIAPMDQLVIAASVLQHPQLEHSQHPDLTKDRSYLPQSNGWSPSSGENGENFVDEPTNEQQPHPILASLVRPGVSDSPPEIIIPACDSSSVPDEYPTKKKIMIQQYNMEKHHHQDDQYSSSPSPPQLTRPSPHPGYNNNNNNNHLNHQHNPHHGEIDEDDSSYHPFLGLGDNSKGGGRGEELPPLPLNTMESILSVAISAEFNSFGLLNNDPNGVIGSGHGNRGGNPSDHSPPSRALNKAERAKLSELFFASEALNAPVDLEDTGPIKIATTDPSLLNVINLTDIAIRRLIKMSKKMYAFKNMCQEDQIALLKGGCTEMMILRSVVSYDPERDSWNIPHSNGFNVKLGVLKEARGNLYEQHQRFVKSFKGEWRADYNIMIILCAITLFTPERPNVIHKDVVKLEQDSYYYLLKRYLESTRNGCDARSTYLQLIQRIAELHILNSNHLRVFLEVNPRDVQPLLIEIFDLKQ